LQISEAPIVDVRGPLTAQRERLLGLLATLDDAQWAAPTAAPRWPVKSIALHLLDVDLSWLARGRDFELTALIPSSPHHAAFVAALGQRYQCWVDGAQELSPRLIIDLLRWSGEQLDAHFGTLSLTAQASVYWAGAAPLWFDLAREFTERWVHFRQIQEAVHPGDPSDEYLPLVLRTFIWGFPHQYRETAAPGTTIALEFADVGAWTLTAAADGWSLDEAEAAAPAASLRMSGEAAWRLLTGASYDAGEIQLGGDPALAAPLLKVRGIIV
jgi:uncharacterized damage-inducible protein DinB